MKYFHYFLVLIALSCQPQKQKRLPILGNSYIDGIDTIYHTIADFKLIDQDSIWVSNETFTNQIYVADFFFTTCPSICPIMSRNMLKVHDAYLEDKRVGILSHTIDPTHDSVAVLKRYAENLGVNSEKWKMVTGEKGYIYDICEKSYMSIADKNDEEPGGYIHSGAFLLVDKKRHIRGVYDGTVEKEVDQLITDIKLLLVEK